ncbi:transposase [Microcoleus sp. N3A4]|uniref:transposase n=1 Tax=Microcoleus sp. N3A4 TaxID=3055379 RepID=UPI00403F9D16
MQARATESQKLAKQLFKTAGIQLITKLKRNMKQRLMPLNDRLMLALARPISKPLSIS